MRVTFLIVAFSVLTPYILVGTSVQPWREATVFLKPVSTVLPEHMLSNGEDHNTNIQNESLKSLVIFFY